jgi:type II secretory pathway pseudopilin PulG
MTHLKRFGRNSRRSGFAVTEVTIVVVIVALFTAFAIPNYRRSREDAKVAKAAHELKILSGAFLAYAAKHGDFPPDSRLDLPPGMQEYINPAIWANETPLGGHYNWEGPDNNPYAELSILQPTASNELLIALDAMIDDGNLADGRFRLGTNGCPALIIAE